MGATYPDDIAAAAKWSAAHTSESGDKAVKAVEGETWDPSVKSLVAFPSVMDLMGRQPDWVKSVGDAFLAQPDGVMDSVQRLRAQAQKAGNLKNRGGDRARRPASRLRAQLQPDRGLWRLGLSLVSPLLLSAAAGLGVRDLAGGRHRFRPGRGRRGFHVGRIQLGTQRRGHQRQPVQQRQRQPAHQQRQQQ
ncbi:hypothetical protein G6F22_016221 [Rhizopus arrhizus]|nr:hypothetical protein G6F22_016221 [Rhizopus arrhizus]